MPSRVEAFKDSSRTGFVYRDIMQDIKTELDSDEEETEEEEDAESEE